MPTNGMNGANGANGKTNPAAVVADLAKFVLTELIEEDDATTIDEHEALIPDLVDSVGAVKLATYIEETYGCEFGPNDFTAENFACLTALAGFVCKT